jgi:hypothetical protein
MGPLVVAGADPVVGEHAQLSERLEEVRVRPRPITQTGSGKKSVGLGERSGTTCS